MATIHWSGNRVLRMALVPFSRLAVLTGPVPLCVTGDRTIHIPGSVPQEVNSHRLPCEQRHLDFCDLVYVYTLHLYIYIFIGKYNR